MVLRTARLIAGIEYNSSTDTPMNSSGDGMCLVAQTLSRLVAFFGSLIYVCLMQNLKLGGGTGMAKSPS
jgi:hypothetical protein